MYFGKNTDGFILLLDISMIPAYKKAIYWLSIIKKKNINKPVLLILFSLNEENVHSHLLNELSREQNVILIKNPIKTELDILNILKYLSCIIFDFQIPDSILARLDIISDNYTNKAFKISNEEVTQLEEGPISMTNFHFIYKELLTNIKEIIQEPTVNKLLPQFEQLEQHIEKQEMRVNSMKGKLLEMNVRLLYEREYGYEMDFTGKNFMCEENEIEVLYDNKCIKKHSTKDIEIDVFGKKIKNVNDLTYLIGECKDRRKKITLKEIKCFIIKAVIIAKFYLYTHSREKMSIPKFHLLIVSYHGFPEKTIIYEILNKYWKPNLSKKRLINENIDLLEEKKFIHLLKKNNISIKEYSN